MGVSQSRPWLWAAGAAMTELCLDMDPEEDPFPPLLTLLLSPCPIQGFKSAGVTAVTLTDQQEKGFFVGKGRRKGAE